jgi:hypothetical protein
MPLPSLRTTLRGLRAAYNGWILESQARVADTEQRVDDTRTRFRDQRAMLGSRLSWCSRCGERLGATDALGAAARDGIHARCHGG